mgnify:CR=1 FL=1
MNLIKRELKAIGQSLDGTSKFIVNLIKRDDMCDSNLIKRELKDDGVVYMDLLNSSRNLIKRELKVKNNLTTHFNILHMNLIKRELKEFYVSSTI